MLWVLWLKMPGFYRIIILNLWNIIIYLYCAVEALRLPLLDWRSCLFAPSSIILCCDWSVFIFVKIRIDIKTLFHWTLRLVHFFQVSIWIADLNFCSSSQRRIPCWISVRRAWTALTFDIKSEITTCKMFCVLISFVYLVKSSVGFLMLRLQFSQFLCVLFLSCTILSCPRS